MLSIKSLFRKKVTDPAPSKDVVADLLSGTDSMIAQFHQNLSI